MNSCSSWYSLKALLGFSLSCFIFVITASLTSHSYAVLNLAYFDFNNNGELPDKLHHLPLEYFKKTKVWMENQPHTSKGRLSVIGNSRGSEAALLLGIQYPEITTVVAIVPSAYVGGAYDENSMVAGSTWTFVGKEIPMWTTRKLSPTMSHGGRL